MFKLLLASTNTITTLNKICITWIAFYIIVFIPTFVVDNDYCLLMASLVWCSCVKSKRIVVMCGWWWCCFCNSYSIGPTYTPKYKQNKIGNPYKVWASLFWDSNAFGNMIWIRSIWWWITSKEKSEKTIENLWIHHIRIINRSINEEKLNLSSICDDVPINCIITS